MNKKVVLGARVLLGLLFLVFGANGLMMVLTGSGFIPMPPPSPADMAVMGGIFSLKYLLPLVKALEIISGILLLCGCYINLALVLLAPIVVNILCVHLFLIPSGLPMGLFIVALLLILFADRWDSFKGLLDK